MELLLYDILYNARSQGNVLFENRIDSGPFRIGQPKAPPFGRWRRNGRQLRLAGNGDLVECAAFGMIAEPSAVQAHGAVAGAIRLRALLLPHTSRHQASLLHGPPGRLRVGLRDLSRSTSIPLSANSNHPVHKSHTKSPDNTLRSARPHRPRRRRGLPDSPPNPEARISARRPNLSARQVLRPPPSTPSPFPRPGV